MNIYLVTRWGNPKEGYNGEDTNFFVNAESAEEAGKFADECLSNMKEDINNPVLKYCHCIRLIGQASVDYSGIIMSHLTGYSIVSPKNYPTWYRNKENLNWTFMTDTKPI